MRELVFIFVLFTAGFSFERQLAFIDSNRTLFDEIVHFINNPAEIRERLTMDPNLTEQGLGHSDRRHVLVDEIVWVMYEYALYRYVLTLQVPPQPMYHTPHEWPFDQWEMEPAKGIRLNYKAFDCEVALYKTFAAVAYDLSPVKRLPELKSFKQKIEKDSYLLWVFNRAKHYQRGSLFLECNACFVPQDSIEVINDSLFFEDVALVKSLNPSVRNVLIFPVDKSDTTTLYQRGIAHDMVSYARDRMDSYLYKPESITDADPEMIAFLKNNLLRYFLEQQERYL